jgi:hypothetical protein
MFKPSRMRFSGLLVVAAVLAIIMVPSVGMAQDVANGSATALVQAILVVTATQALQFGNVFQGVATSVANDAAGAGIFSIAGQGAAPIAIYMQLPDYLSTASGDDRMVISFGLTDASVDSTGNLVPTTFGAGWADTDPHNFNPATVVGTLGVTAVFLGGSVFPSVDQAAGAYSADIIVTVAYTGV